MSVRDQRGAERCDTGLPNCWKNRRQLFRCEQGIRKINPSKSIYLNVDETGTDTRKIISSVAKGLD